MSEVENCVDDSIMNGPDYENLPPEILIKIFHYLDFYDIQSARLCCKKWFAVAALPDFDSKCMVKIMACNLDGNHPAADVIFNKNIEKLYLKNVQFGDVDKLFQHIGISLRYLTLKLVPIAPAVRLAMQYFPRLRSLRVTKVKLNTFVEKLSDLPVANFSCLKDLQLASNESSINKYFLNSLQQKNTLERLTVEFTQDDELEILKVIETQSGSLKRLDLRFYEGKVLTVQEWARVFQDLNLQDLTLQGSFCIDIITSAIYDQKSLRSLDLTGSVAVDDGFLTFLTQRTPTLEKINLGYCGRITDRGVVQLRKLPKLKSLDITSCNMVTTLSVCRIVGEPNRILQELHLQELHMCEVGVSYFTSNLPNLKLLNLSGCGKAVTDDVIQEIFECLTKLKELWVDHCSSITDAGILGFKTGASIQCLKHLKRLSLRGCKQVTDLSLISGLKFAQLKFLDISYCDTMTNEGLVALIKNCPTLEEMHMTRNKGITADGVRSLTTGLRRLRMITINNCASLLPIGSISWNQSRVRTFENEITLKRYPRNK